MLTLGRLLRLGPNNEEFVGDATANTLLIGEYWTPLVVLVEKGSYTTTLQATPREGTRPASTGTPGPLTRHCRFMTF